MIDSILTAIAAHADKIPFVMATGTNKVQLSIQKILEASIVGVALALVGTLTFLPVLKSEFDAVQRSVEGLTKEVRGMAIFDAILKTRLSHIEREQAALWKKLDELQRDNKDH